MYPDLASDIFRCHLELSNGGFELHRYFTKILIYKGILIFTVPFFVNFFDFDL